MTHHTCDRCQAPTDNPSVLRPGEAWCGQPGTTSTAGSSCARRVPRPRRGGRAEGPGPLTQEWTPVPDPKVKKSVQLARESQVWEMSLKGKTCRAMAEVLGISHQAVWKILKRVERREQARLSQ